MLRPKRHVSRTLESRQVFEAFVTAVQPYVRLELHGTRLTSEEMWAILGDASVQQCSIESACAELEAAPSANRRREVLHAALPERAVL